MHDQTFTEFDRALTARWERTSATDRMLVAHVSNSHMLQPQETRRSILEDFPSPTWGREHLHGVVRELQSLSQRPDLLLLGGDMTHTGDPTEWDLLFATLSPLRVPLLFTLGNCEHRNNVIESTTFQTSMASLGKRGFGPGAVSGQLAYTRRVGSYQIVVLDSMHSGDLGAEQHEFLRKELKGGRPTVVLVHRPILRTGQAVDQLRLIDPTYEQILADASNVAVVLCGHAHCRRTAIEQGRLHFLTPSVNFGNADPTGYRLVCLADGKVAWSGTRLVAGESCHAFRGPIITQQGGTVWEEF